MKPAVDSFLQVAVMHLLTRTSQALGESYEQSNVMIMAGMLMAVQQEFERAAARRVEENSALRKLFADSSAAVIDNPGLAKRLADAAAGPETSFLISDLERENAELRSLLIDLHAHVETLDTPETRRARDEIWRELVASTERRRLPIGRF